MKKAGIYSLTVSLLLLISCTKETVEVLPGGVFGQELKGKISYKFNGTQHIALSQIRVEDIDSINSVFIGICKSEGAILRFYIYDTISGTYPISQNQTERGTAFITYFDNPNSNGVPYTSTEGEVVFTINNGKASGSFHSTVFKSAGAATAQITDGAFSELEID